MYIKRNFVKIAIMVSMASLFCFYEALANSMVRPDPDASYLPIHQDGYPCISLPAYELVPSGMSFDKYDYSPGKFSLPKTTAYVFVDRTLDIPGSELSDSSGFGELTVELINRWPFSFRNGEVIEEMCAGLNSVTFGMMLTEKFPFLSIGPFENVEHASCLVRIGKMQEAFDDISKSSFPKNKLYIWPGGWSGYLLFTNALFPDSSGNYSTKIDSARLKNLLSFAVTNDPGRHRYYPIDMIETRPEQVFCNCISAFGSPDTQLLINSERASCVKRDGSGRTCAGEKEVRQAFYKPRWYFDIHSIDCQYLRFKSFKYSDIALYKSDYDDEVFIRYWCQIDPYFPCTEIEILVLDSEKHFADFLSKRLCGDQCEWTSATTLNVSRYGNRISDLDSPNSTEKVNELIKKFARGSFGFLAVPLGIATLPGVVFNGIVPVDIENDNEGVSERIRQLNYFLINKFDVAMSSHALKDAPLRNYLQYLYANDTGKKYSCYKTDHECLANMHREKFHRTIWLRPIR